MQNESYYDPMYGKVHLPDIVFELMQMPEVIRLGEIGMMNFRSLNKITLTKISRLEHSIGTALLVSKFSESNDHIKNNLNTFLCAALLHDASCSAFGHAVEWAVNRHKKNDHVTKIDWVEKDKQSTNGAKPIYYGSNPSGGIEYRIKQKYGIKADLITKIIEGSHTCVISSSGIDLDNIDNVSRMAFALGLLDDRLFPMKLAGSLRLSEDKNHFVVDEVGLELIEYWLALRKKVYTCFIYSSDYISYESALFNIVNTYISENGKGEAGFFDYVTDSYMIEQFAQGKHGSELKRKAANLLNYNLPKCVGIISLNKLDAAERYSLDSIVLEAVRSDFKKSKESLKNIHDENNISIHVTTDFRKTSRSVEVIFKDRFVVLGNEESRTLICMLYDGELSKVNASLLLETAYVFLKSRYSDVEIVSNFYECKNPNYELF